MYPQQRFAAFLFDMDGTLLTSIASAERVWSRWAERHGLDVAAFLPTIHGVQGVETIRRQNLPGVDPHAEALGVLEEEMRDTEGTAAIDGILDFLQSLPPQRWAIVTSAPRELALVRLQAAGIQPPALLITAEDAPRGKPAPDCFLLAAERLGVDIRQCLVFEDAPAGIAAAQAAGAKVAVITATHSHPLDTEHPTLSDYAGYRVSVEDDGLELHPI